MKERLFLDGITLHAAHIAPGHVKGSTLVVTNLADSGLAVGNGAAMAAGIAAHAIAVEFLVEITFSNVLVQDVAQGGHVEPLHGILDLIGRGLDGRKTTS